MAEIDGTSVVRMDGLTARPTQQCLTLDGVDLCTLVRVRPRGCLRDLLVHRPGHEVERVPGADPIGSDRYYTLATLWLPPSVFNLTFRRRWGLWPTAVFLLGGTALAIAGVLEGARFWNPVLAGWVCAGDLLVMTDLAVPFPVAVATRSPGCELGAIPWLIARRQGRADAAPRPGCAVGLDRLDRWEASRWRRDRDATDS
jgi:hypothetical protein